MSYRDDVLSTIGLANIKVNEVLEQYFEGQAPDRLMPVFPEVGSTENGIPYYLGLTNCIDMEIFRVPALENLRAYFRLNHLEQVRIGYAAGLNRCWARFLTCKELAHYFLGRDDNRTTIDNIDKLLTSLTNDETIMSNDTPKDVIVEHLAYFFAIELLIPRQYVERYHSLKSEGKTNREIAELFRVPETIVDYRFSSNGDSLFQEAYAKLDSPSV